MIFVFSAFTDTIIPVHVKQSSKRLRPPLDSPPADYKRPNRSTNHGLYAKTHERGKSGVGSGDVPATIAGFRPADGWPRNAAGEATAKDEFDLFTTDVLAGA